MKYKYLTIILGFILASNINGQEWQNGLSYPVNRNGELQSAMNGGGYWNNNPDFPVSTSNSNFPSAQTITQGIWNNSFAIPGYVSRNARPIDQYNYIASTQQEGNYWTLILKDSSNIIRMKGSYSDPELTTPEGIFYYYHSNGNVSMYGLYNQGLRNGIWISNYANGKLKDSISFWNGQKNGKFLRYHLNGSIYISGNYVEDELHGTWLEYYKNNQPASISNYVKGKINTVIYYTKSGEKIVQEQPKQSPKLFFNSRCEIVEELVNANFYGTPLKLPNGNTSCVLYDMEGNKIVTVQWSDPALSKKSGPFEQYDTTGILRFSGNYDNNQLNGIVKAWYETGILANAGNMKKNMRDGNWESWYESGQKKDSGTFVNDVPTGLWSIWDENGNTKTTGAFGKNGRIGDWKTYDRNGKILFIERYRKSKNGEPELIVFNKQ